MQKVEGSNPFSRFHRKPASEAGFCLSWTCTPRLSRLLGAVILAGSAL